MGKYVEGRKFTCVQEILCWALDGKAIYYLGKCRNSVWVLSQQVIWLHNHLDLFSKAIRKEDIRNGKIKS